MMGYCYRDPIMAPPDNNRPRWSVMIPTFNDGAYLEQALRGVLSQDPGPEVMQIEVVDDCSTRGNARTLVNDIGGGRVGYFRQYENVGVTRNLTTCISRARGSLVHLLHGDDLVLPGFYSRLDRAFDHPAGPGLAFCRHLYIDADAREIGCSPKEMKTAGLLPLHLSRMAEEQIMMTPSVVVRREAYEALGGFDHRLRCAEDWEMWVRVAASYPVWYEPAVGACYRIHPDGNTGRNSGDAAEMAYTRVAIDMMRDYLPAEVATRVHRRARETYARSALDSAFERFRMGDARGMRAYIGTALRMSRSPRVAARLFGLAGRIAGTAIRNQLVRAQS